MIYNAIDEMVKLVKSDKACCRRNRFRSSCGKLLGTGDFVKEHLTIKVAGPRQTGNSTDMIKWAFDHSTFSDSSIIFGANQRMTGYLKDKYSALKAFYGYMSQDFIKIYSINTLTNHIINFTRGRHISYILVDDASYVTKVELDKVYELAHFIYMNQSREVLVILVG